VAVVIFGGLISSTLLDTLLTPLAYAWLGEPATRKILAEASTESF
jgi:HME family heavy-metal exporter